MRVTLSNGLIVERKGESGSLKVTDPDGRKGGQQLLNEFVEQLALNLPKFIEATPKAKAETLLKIIGVGDKLHAIDAQIEQRYNQRTEIGRIAQQKHKYADELPVHADAPAEEISISELIQRQQAILAKNGENQRLRRNRDICEQELARAQQAFDLAAEVFEKAKQDAEVARKSAEDLTDESTAEIEQSIADIDVINRKVRENASRERAEQDAADLDAQYAELTETIENLRTERTNLLNNADLPLAGLSVEGGELTYNGAKWDCMSASEQLRVAVAIVRRLNPECGFVLMDKLEQMDTATLADFGKWLESEGLQVIATRVSTGGECSVIIEDGTSVLPEKTWQKGVF